MFYNVAQLPQPWSELSYPNPILYMVNAFRYGLLGVVDVDLTWAYLIMLGFVAGLGALCLNLLHRGVGFVPESSSSRLRRHACRCRGDRDHSFLLNRGHRSMLRSFVALVAFFSIHAAYAQDARRRRRTKCSSSSIRSTSRPARSRAEGERRSR